MCSIDCQCIPGTSGKTYCGWIGRADGIVRPCDPGCCQPACDGPAPSELSQYQQTTGVGLPPNFGLNLVTGETPTSRPWEAEFKPAEPYYGPAYHIRFFWLLFLIGLIVLMALFLI